MSRKPRRMCVRCQVLTDDPVTVAEVHGDSGPGWSVYACPDCAALYGGHGPLGVTETTGRTAAEDRR